MVCMIFGVPSGISLYCQQCERNVDTLVQNGEVIYPRRKDLADYVFLQCPHCGNYVGADAFRPQDTINKWKRRHDQKVIPTAQFRIYRRRIHSLIDPVWKKNIMKRGTIYRRLSKATGVKYHNSSLHDTEVMKKALKEARKIRREAEIMVGHKLTYEN